MESKVIIKENEIILEIKSNCSQCECKQSISKECINLQMQ